MGMNINAARETIREVQWLLRKEMAATTEPHTGERLDFLIEIGTLEQAAAILHRRRPDATPPPGRRPAKERN